MKKKALIVTWFWNNSYGQALQAYAMKQIFEKKGFETEFLSYRPQMKKNNWFWFYYLNHTCLEDVQYQIRQVKFEFFIGKKLKITKPCNTIEQVKVLVRKKKYDLLVCGSDQIWNPDCYDPVYFLDFCTGCNEIKLAYAPSICAYDMVKSYGKTVEKMKESIQKLDSVSVREKNGCQIVSNLTGEMPENVLDPVLMVSAKQWSKLAGCKKTVRRYILCYFIGQMKSYEPVIKKMAEIHHTNNIIVINSNLVPKQKGYKNKTNIGPRTFLSLLRDAEFVCTDSFHGTAFCIHFEKQFFAFRRNQIGRRGKEKVYFNFYRIQNLLELVGLENRIINSCLQKEQLNKAINYEPVKRKLYRQRKRSWNFIVQSIQKKE